MRTPEYLDGHGVVVIANDMTYEIGPFDPIGD